MKIRCKMQLVSITEHCWNESKTLRFQAMYDESIEEDRRFAKASPAGHMEINVDNPIALAHFVKGRYYYFDAIEVEETGRIENA